MGRIAPGRWTRFGTGSCSTDAKAYVHPPVVLLDASRFFQTCAVWIRSPSGSVMGRRAFHGAHGWTPHGIPSYSRAKRCGRGRMAHCPCPARPPRARSLQSAWIMFSDAQFPRTRATGKSGTCRRCPVRNWPRTWSSFGSSGPLGCRCPPISRSVCPLCRTAYWPCTSGCRP